MKELMNKLYAWKVRLMVAVIFCAIFLAAIWMVNKDNNQYQATSAGQYVSGTVTEMISDNTQPDYENSEGLRLGDQEVKVKITSGAHKGEIHQVTNHLSALYNIDVKKGTKVMLLITPQQNGSYQVSIYAYDRSMILLVVLLVFFLLLALIGGWKGIKSVAGLAFTLICLIFLLIPLVSKGWSAMWTTMLIISVTALVCFLLLDGVKVKTIAAFISTVSGVFVAFLLCLAVEKIAHLSGYNMQEAENLILISQQKGMNIKGLLTSGILLASMGAVMDVAITVTSAVSEIYEANNKLNANQLFQKGMNVGKDAMGTMANTLVLAFVGTSFNMLLLVFSYGIPFFRLINTDSIAIEIIQAVAGSIGIISAVPLAALTACMLTHSKVVKKYLRS